eukprot:358671-Chlamydomonas_euryale.AAC.3
MGSGRGRRAADRAPAGARRQTVPELGVVMQRPRRGRTWVARSVVVWQRSGDVGKVMRRRAH